MNLLTICIPTYNRASKLDENLQHLFLILSKLADKTGIKLLISDNNSSDHTGYVCQNYMKCKWFEYVKQETNIGLDGQHFFFSKNVTSQYIWVAGDDDIIPESTLLSVLDVLNSIKPQAVFLNVSQYHSPDLWKFSFYPKSYSKIIHTGNVEAALNIVRDNFQFISSQVFKLDTVKEAYKTAFYANLKDINIYACLVAMSGRSVILPHKFILTNHSSEDRIQDNYDSRWIATFWDRPKQAIILYEKFYCKLNHDRISKFFYRQDFQFIRSYLMYSIDESRYHQPSWSDIQYLHSPQSKILASILFVCPRKVLLSLMRTYRLIKRALSK